MPLGIIALILVCVLEHCLSFFQRLPVLIMISYVELRLREHHSKTHPQSNAIIDNKQYCILHCTFKYYISKVFKHAIYSIVCCLVNLHIVKF